MRANPYQLVEGVLIAAYAIGAASAFICLKASFEPELAAVTRVVQEMQAAGICADCSITIVRGPDEYLYGEEKAMLAVIEGGDPLPGLLPPLPAWTLRHSTPDRLGGPDCRGLRRPSAGVEPDSGQQRRHLSQRAPHPDAGQRVVPFRGNRVLSGDAGVHRGRRCGGPSGGDRKPARRAPHLGGLRRQRQLGAGGFIVYDDTACMVDVARVFSRFLAVESCGQCPPCKLGSGEITDRLERIEAGTGTAGDVEDMVSWLAQVTDGNRCYLAVEEQAMVSSVLRAFPDEFAEHIELGRCPRPRKLPIPKLVDLANGQATYDETFWYKRPDWTFDAPPHRRPQGDISPD